MAFEPLAPIALDSIGNVSDGRVSIDMDFLRWLENLQQLALGRSTPPGTVQMYDGDTEPEGWKFLNGQSLSKRLYPALYAIYGGKFGETATEFKLPDRRDHVAMGAGGRVALGEVIGNSEITLTIDQMPEHSHEASAAPHTHEAEQEPHDHQLDLDPHTHTASEVEGEEHTHDFTSDPHRHAIDSQRGGAANNAAAGTDVTTGTVGNTGFERVTGTTDPAGAALSIVTDPANVTGHVSQSQPEITVEEATSEITVETTGGGQPIDITPLSFGTNFMVKT